MTGCAGERGWTADSTTRELRKCQPCAGPARHSARPPARPQERQRAHGLQAALAEAQLMCGSQRAALQGRGDEVASLAASLDLYSQRIVASEGQLEDARQAAAAALEGRQAAEAAAQAAAHEAACLREAIEDLALAEVQLQEELREARAAAAAAEAAAEQARQHGAQQECDAAAAREEAGGLRAAVVEQTAQLKQAAGRRQQLEAAQQQLTALGEELRCAAASRAAAQAASDVVDAARQAAERSLHKQTVLSQRLQEQAATLSAQLAAVTKEVAAATARAEAAEATAARQAEEHAAAVAALQASHAQRKSRWVSRIVFLGPQLHLPRVGGNQRGGSSAALEPGSGARLPPCHPIAPAHPPTHQTTTRPGTSTWSTRTSSRRC